MNDFTITADQKLEILIDYGADSHTLCAVARCLDSDSFSDLADMLIGEFTGTGNTYTLADWARISYYLTELFA